jgi:hypothetical protein
VSRKRKRDAAPIAPHEIGRLAARRWAHLGRRDARRYGALLDFTPTHSLIRAEAESQQRQHAVNAWLIDQVRPDITGNARIRISKAKALADHAVVQGDKTTSPRAKHTNALRLERIEANLANMDAQLSANVAKILATKQTAVEALGTWETFYFQKAAVYTRARANAGRQAVSSVSAEVPSMRSIALVEIEGLDDVESSATTGGRK